MKRDSNGRFIKEEKSVLIHDQYYTYLSNDAITRFLERFRDFFEKNGLWVLFYLAVLYAGYTWLKWR